MNKFWLSAFIMLVIALIVSEVFNYQRIVKDGERIEMLENPADNPWKIAGRECTSNGSFVFCESVITTNAFEITEKIKMVSDKLDMLSKAVGYDYVDESTNTVDAHYEKHETKKDVQDGFDLPSPMPWRK